MAEDLGNKSQLTGSINIWRILLMLLSLVMVGVSLYLTNHYYDVQYPTTYFSTSMCDVSTYWNCDTATFSALSNIFGVPTSVFGLIVGLFFLIGSFWGNQALERTNLALSLANGLGCIGLFFYSVLALGGLCPVCTIYYACSLLVAAILWFKGSKNFTPDTKVSGVWALIFLAITGGAWYYTSEKEKSIEKTAEHILGEFRKSANYEAFNFESPYRLASATEKFSDAPLRITLFSDFQCPVCKVLAEKIIPKLISHYKGKLNFQYFYYPMDNNCNHNLGQPMHPMACEASYVAACLPEKFTQIHDEIYAAQNELSRSMLQRLANTHGASTCYNDIKAKEIVENMILEADKIGVQATPTMLINGKKLEGLMPLKFMILLCEEAMKSGK